MGRGCRGGGTLPSSFSPKPFNRSWSDQPYQLHSQKFLLETVPIHSSWETMGAINQWVLFGVVYLPSIPTQTPTKLWWLQWGFILPFLGSRAELTSPVQLCSFPQQSLSFPEWIALRNQTRKKWLNPDLLWAPGYEFLTAKVHLWITSFILGRFASEGNQGKCLSWAACSYLHPSYQGS